MRRSVRVLLLAAVLAVAVACVAEAKWTVFRAGNVILRFDGGISPNRLPRDRMVPVAVLGKVDFSTADGSHVPAFRGGTFDADRNVEIDAKGIPACRKGQLEASNSEAARDKCGDAIVGSGSGKVEIAFPEQPPITAKSPLTFFNGGVKGGTTTLFVHVFITVPVPAAIVTTVKFRRLDEGRYGLRFVSEVPVIAGGSGSVVAASFKLQRRFERGGAQRSYLSARCPDGRFKFRIVEAEVKDELSGLTPPGGVPGLSGTIVRPCTQVG